MEDGINKARVQICKINNKIEKEGRFLQEVDKCEGGEKSKKIISEGPRLLDK